MEVVYAECARFVDVERSGMLMADQLEELVTPSGPSLLVVDDSESSRVVLFHRLQQAGYEVVLASCGHEALERIRETRIDLVLLDLIMPHMSGLELLTLLRGTWSRHELPIIMLTGSARNGLVASALASGANDYILKPIDLSAIHERIQAQLRRKRLKQELLHRLAQARTRTLALPR